MEPKRWLLKSPCKPNSKIPTAGIFLCEDGNFHETNLANKHTGNKAKLLTFEEASHLQYRHLKQTNIRLQMVDFYSGEVR